LWISANAYPHPAIAGRPFTRVALVPAFQPLGLRAGGGDGADPDAFVYPNRVPALNEYFPTYPVDMALARYEQSGDDRALRELGVSEVAARPWLVSKTRGGIGLAATSLQPKLSPRSSTATRYLRDSMPLIAACQAMRVVASADTLGSCDVFFGDAPGYDSVVPVIAPSDSIDARTDWIDARLAFAESPALAQAIGGALTQSELPLPVMPDSWLLAFVRGKLLSSRGDTLTSAPGEFVWVRVPSGIGSVHCEGLCELVAQASSVPRLPPVAQSARAPVAFARVAPWLYIVRTDGKPGALLRFNESYDPAWIAFGASHELAHVRVDMSVNGWLLDGPSTQVTLVQTTALLQLSAEIIGAFCVLWLLKALAQPPTKRVP
jgi:hypothetical protein